MGAYLLSIVTDIRGIGDGSGEMTDERSVWECWEVVEAKLEGGKACAFCLQSKVTGLGDGRTASSRVLDLASRNLPYLDLEQLRTGALSSFVTICLQMQPHVLDCVLVVYSIKSFRTRTVTMTVSQIFVDFFSLAILK